MSYDDDDPTKDRNAQDVPPSAGHNQPPENIDEALTKGQLLASTTLGFLVKTARKLTKLVTAQEKGAAEQSLSTLALTKEIATLVYMAKQGQVGFDGVLDALNDAELVKRLRKRGTELKADDFLQLVLKKQDLKPNTRTRIRQGADYLASVRVDSEAAFCNHLLQFDTMDMVNKTREPATTHQSEASAKKRQANIDYLIEFGGGWYAESNSDEITRKKGEAFHVLGIPDGEGYVELHFPMTGLYDKEDAEWFEKTLNSMINRLADANRKATARLDKEGEG